jgi:2-dehydro-3-deoxygluconokinase
MIDWEKALENGKWFHWTGITPALKKGSKDALLDAVKLARAKGMTVSADPTYRSGLWKYGENPKDVLSELIKYSTIFIGGINEINELLDTNYTYSNDDFIIACKHLIEEYPNIEKVFDKIRTSINSSWHKMKARMWNGVEFKETEELDITHIVDRIGTGDAFAAGLIYGLLHFDDEKAIDFAASACALKHTVPGDVNTVSLENVISLMEGNTSGAIVR